MRRITTGVVPAQAGTTVLALRIRARQFRLAM